MIWAPPMMVRIRDAWPGQSTSVNCSSLQVQVQRCLKPKARSAQLED